MWPVASQDERHGYPLSSTFHPRCRMAPPDGELTQSRSINPCRHKTKSNHCDLIQPLLLGLGLIETTHMSCAAPQRRVPIAFPIHPSRTIAHCCALLRTIANLSTSPKILCVSAPLWQKTRGNRPKTDSDRLKKLICLNSLSIPFAFSLRLRVLA